MSTASSSLRLARSPLPNLLPYAALIAAMLTLMVGTSTAKQIFPIVGAQGTVAYRLGFASLMLLAFWRPWRARWSRDDLGRIALYGTVMGLMNLSFYMALRTIPLGVAIAIEFLGPLTVALFHSRKATHFLWLGLALAGLTLLLPIRGDSAALDPVGVGFALAAALFWALYIVFGRRTGHLHAGHSVALGTTMAALIAVPVGVIEAGSAMLSPLAIGLGLLVALLSSAIPYSLEMIALRSIPQRSFGVLLSVEPALGAVAGLVLLGETVSGEQWLAIALIVAASAGSILTGDKGGGDDLASA